tara:strand:- start:184 stop:477 length:294 start_codon:yes stop_codon:yes gene_type:complete
MPRKKAKVKSSQKIEQSKNPLPDDYIVTYREDGRFGFVYYAKQGATTIQYTANIFVSEDEAEKEAYEWLFSQDVADDERRQIRFENKNFFLEHASIH